MSAERVRVRLIRTDGTDADIARAAAISYGKDSVEPTRVEPIIRGLIANQELVPFEFAAFWFQIRCSRACHAQVLQYRHASRITRSLRRTKPIELEEPDLAAPEAMAMLEHYKGLLAMGEKKEKAREVLSMATLTEFNLWLNLRSLMHFLEERLSFQAQEEIRHVAGQMRDAFKQNFPVTFQAWAEAYFHHLEET